MRRGLMRGVFRTLTALHELGMVCHLHSPPPRTKVCALIMAQLGRLLDPSPAHRLSWREVLAHLQGGAGRSIGRIGLNAQKPGRLSGLAHSHARHLFRLLFGREEEGRVEGLSERAHANDRNLVRPLSTDGDRDRGVKEGPPMLACSACPACPACSAGEDGADGADGEGVPCESVGGPPNAHPLPKFGLWLAGLGHKIQEGLERHLSKVRGMGETSFVFWSFG